MQAQSTSCTFIAAVGNEQCVTRCELRRQVRFFLPSPENEMRVLAISLCALALLPVASSAQQTSRLSPTGPSIQAASVGFRVTDAKVDASTKITSAPLVARHQGQDVALMAVGVGAMIAGALIGDTPGTIILIGGAGMALFGLYHYLE
jgi:hypothetical protein